MMKLPEHIYQQIYDLLVKEAGALEWERDGFVQYFSKDREATEWRFCGKLGFGGKFWNNAGKLYISCYPEDEDDERYCIIEAVNIKLQDLLNQYLTNPVA